MHRRRLSVLLHTEAKYYHGCSARAQRVQMQGADLHTSLAQTDDPFSVTVACETVDDCTTLAADLRSMPVSNDRYMKQI